METGREPSCPEDMDGHQFAVSRTGRVPTRMSGVSQIDLAYPLLEMGPQLSLIPCKRP